MENYIQTTLDQKIKQIWSYALKHKAASIVGLPDDVQDYQLCKCCNQPISKKPIPLCQHTKEFQIFGFGYPLWFSFLKYCIILVVILIVSKTSGQIYMATKQNYEFCYGNHSQVQSQHKKHHHESYFKNIHNQKNIHLRNSFNHFKIEFQNHNQNNQFFHVTQHKSHSKHHQVCTSVMIYLSYFKGQEYTQNIFLRSIQFIIHLLALIGIRNMIIKQEQYYDQRTCSLSDYSLMIYNLPQVYNIQNKIRQFVKLQLSNQQKPLQIKQMIYIFKQQKLQKLQNQIEYLEKQIIQAYIINDNLKIKKLQEKLQYTQKQLKELTLKVKNDIKRDYIKCDKMMIVFNSQEEKKQALNNFNSLKNQESTKIDYSSYFYEFNDKTHQKLQIQLKQAPEPNQLNWQHIDQSDIKRKTRILYGWFLTILFLVVVTVIFYLVMLAKTNLFVQALQMQIQDPQNSNVKHFKLSATIIVYLSIFGVVLFNKFIMGKFLHYFVHLQKHAYIDKQNFSFALKYSLGMFFTTALMTLAVEAITFKNFYSHPFGVIQQQTIMFLVTAFLIPLIWLIHPYNLYKKIEYFFNKDKLLSSKRAHQLIQDFPYDLGKRYAQIFEIMWFTFLYSSLIPVGSFLILVGLILYYWVDKYNFLRRSVLKAGISGKMAILGLKALDATLFLAPAGQALFQFILHYKIDYQPIIFAFLGIIYLFLPITNLIELINSQQFFLEQKTYDQAKNIFKQNYMTLNPMYKLTHKEEINQHFENVRQYQKNKIINHPNNLKRRRTLERKLTNQNSQ